MGKHGDLTGRVFARWTVLSYFGKDANSRHFWRCRCICGGEKNVPVVYLINGQSKSCGCLVRENDSRKTHGQSTSKECAIYYGAKGRCQNKNNPKYPSYGGRGIKFLFSSFEDFINELGPRPSPNHSVDRIDNDGNYEKGNIRWAERTTQANNARSNIPVTIDGVIKNLSQWCNDTESVSYSTAYKRIKVGWCGKCALYNGKKQTCPHKKVRP